jgi:hypothetical protein
MDKSVPFKTSLKRARPRRRSILPYQNFAQSRPIKTSLKRALSKLLSNLPFRNSASIDGGVQAVRTDG